MTTRQILLPAALFISALPLIACGDDDEDDVVRACIKSTACNVRAYPRVADCVDGYNNVRVPDGMAPVFNAIYSCVAEAGDCAAVKACYGVGGTCDSSYQASCDGGKAHLCDLVDKTTFVYDCAAHGLGCEIRPVGGTSFDASCTGGEGGGKAGAVDCDDGSCERTGKGCTSDDYDRCAGERLEACMDSEWVAFDCAKLGLGACMTSSPIPSVIVGSCQPKL